MAVAWEAPTPTRTDAAGIRPVAALGEKASLSAKDTAAYCDRRVGSAATDADVAQGRGGRSGGSGAGGGGGGGGACEPSSKVSIGLSASTN